MKKFLSVFLSLILFLSLFLVSGNSVSAETNVDDSVSVEANFLNQNGRSDVAARIGLPNAVKVSSSGSGGNTKVYATNIGVDTVDSVSATFVVQRYNHNKKWVNVRTKTMSIKNLAPGKKLLKKFSNPQKYGYEKQILSFVAKDGKSITTGSVDNTRTKNPYNWKSIKTLADHTYRHAGDFGLSYDEMAYSKKANSHYKNRKDNGYEYFVGKDDNIRVYHASSNSFGSYDSNGKTKTYYKPSRGKNYWKDQKKLYKK